MRKITRREFIYGGSVIAGAGAAGIYFAGDPIEVSPEIKNAVPRVPNGSPASKLGMRGSHDGSFEVFHDMSWQGGTQWTIPEDLNEEPYDLVIVGAGLSGLSAAWRWQERAAGNSRILILDNHDDFGGHAKRNEFYVDGKQLLGAGGSTSITWPNKFSPDGLDLLEKIGVRWQRFLRGWGMLPSYLDVFWYTRHGVGKKGRCYPQGFNGLDTSVVSDDPFAMDSYNEDELTQMLSAMPVSQQTRERLFEIIHDEPKVFPELTEQQRLNRLTQITYEDYLRDELTLPEDGIELLRRELSVGSAGVGWDVLAADIAAAANLPGLRGITSSERALIYTYPDGNATLARLLVRGLIPQVAPHSRQVDQDIILADFDYDALDNDGSATRIRLNSTVINAQHTADKNQVDVTFVNDGAARKVRASHVILANWNQTIPYICPELPEQQKTSLRSQQKAPSALVNIALINWRPFADAGYVAVTYHDMFYDLVALPLAVGVGGYAAPESPDDPIVISAYHYSTASGAGDPREQMRLARHSLLKLDFSTFEEEAIKQLTEVWGPYGFTEDHISAITVNRWPHGSAPTWSSLYDSGDDFLADDTPHAKARKKFGRISIANSDSEGEPTAQAAFNAADRAVQEQSGT